MECVVDIVMYIYIYICISIHVDSIDMDLSITSLRDGDFMIGRHSADMDSFLANHTKEHTLARHGIRHRYR